MKSKPSARYRNAIKRAKQKGALPKWVDRRELIRIYNECPKDMLIDHIIPLNGELVSGLHVPENLQYLTQEEENKKGNEFVPIFSIG